MRNLFLCALALVLPVGCGDTVVTTQDISDEDAALGEALKALLGPTDDPVKVASEAARLMGYDSFRMYIALDPSEEIAADVPDPECEIIGSWTRQEWAEFALCWRGARADPDCSDELEPILAPQEDGTEVLVGFHIHCEAAEVS